MSNGAKVEGFLRSVSEAAITITETVEEDGFIHVFSHLDADGIAAAGIVGKALTRLDARFRIRITHWVDDKLISEVLAERPQLAIFMDLGSGYVSSLKCTPLKAVILDHHQVNGDQAMELVHVNPHLYGIDGARDFSCSGVAYLVAKEMDGANVDLAPVAVVGALGDQQDRYEQRMLGGLNEKVVEDAVNADLLMIEKDLMLFGRETRPIHKALASTTNPFIPGISCEEDRCLTLLAGLGIKLKDGERWRALRDLSDEERRKLCSALAERLLSVGLQYEVQNLIGYVYVLKNEEPWTPLRDGREFSVLLNATGRMGKPSLGVAICMGDRGSALEGANEVLDGYRKVIGKYIRWIVEEPGRVREMENIYVVYGEDFINDKAVGAVSSILLTSLQKPEKPLIVYADVESEGLVKVSARTTDAAIRRGVNLGEIMRIAAERCFGRGGGHNVAAGAQVPSGSAEAFIRVVDELVGKQLRGEGLGGQYHDQVR